MSEENGNGSNERRQRQMDFILEHQAKFSADIEELKAADERAARRVERLERLAKLFVRAGARERRAFTERYNMLLDAQIKTEEVTRHNSSDVANLIVATTRNGLDVANLITATTRNSDDVANLIVATTRNGLDVANLIAATTRNSDDVANLIVATTRTGAEVVELRNAVAQTSETVNRLADAVAHIAARQTSNDSNGQG